MSRFDEVKKKVFLLKAAPVSSTGAGASRAPSGSSSPAAAPSPVNKAALLAPPHPDTAPGAKRRSQFGWKIVSFVPDDVSAPKRVRTQEIDPAAHKRVRRGVPCHGFESSFFFIRLVLLI